MLLPETTLSTKIRQNHIYPSTLQSICQGNDQPITWGTALSREREYTVRRNLFRFKGALKWIAVYAAFTGGIVEETVFRRMLMEWLADNGINTLWQIGISGVAFGLVHISWGLLGGISRIGAASALATTVLGLLLALVYVVAARNVLPAIAAHTLINLFVEPWLIVHAIGSAQGRKEPQEEADYPAP